MGLEDFNPSIRFNPTRLVCYFDKSKYELDYPDSLLFFKIKN